jgi:hypothetical protein
MRTFLLIIGICTITLIAMAGHLYGSTSTNHVSRHAAIASRGYNISIIRTGCYGDCPIYTLHLDGKAKTRLILEGVTEGDQNEPDLVHFIYEWQVTDTKRKSIISLAETGGFRTLNLDYVRGNPDLERRVITISTERGSWSTTVYGIPCVSKARKRRQEPSDQSDEMTLVPDVFCKLESELHQVACDTLSQGKRVDRVLGADPFQPPVCEP